MIENLEFENYEEWERNYEEDLEKAVKISDRLKLDESATLKIKLIINQSVIEHQEDKLGELLFERYKKISEDVYCEIYEFSNARIVLYDNKNNLEVTIVSGFDRSYFIKSLKGIVHPMAKVDEYYFSEEVFLNFTEKDFEEYEKKLEILEELLSKI